MFTRRPWLHKLQLADIWRNEEMSFEERRDETVRRIKAAPFYDEEDEELYLTVDEMADTEDVRWFDLVWDNFYDWADEHRVWVETF